MLSDGHIAFSGVEKEGLHPARLGMGRAHSQLKGTSAGWGLPNKPMELAGEACKKYSCQGMIGTKLKRSALLCALVCLVHWKQLPTASLSHFMPSGAVWLGQTASKTLHSVHIQSGTWSDSCWTQSRPIVSGSFCWSVNSKDSTNNFQSGVLVPMALSTVGKSHERI